MKKLLCRQLHKTFKKLVLILVSFIPITNNNKKNIFKRVFISITHSSFIKIKSKSYLIAKIKLIL